MAVKASIKAKTKTGGRALCQPELWDVKSAAWHLWLSVDWDCVIDTLRFSYHIAEGLSFAHTQLKEPGVSIMLLPSSRTRLWESCFAVSTIASTYNHKQHDVYAYGQANVGFNALPTWEGRFVVVFVDVLELHS